MLTALFLMLASPPAAAELPVYKPDSNAARADVPDVYKWDLSAIIADDAAWQTEYDTMGADINELSRFAGQLEDPARLYGCLEEYFDVFIRATHLAQYAGLRGATAGTDAAAGTMDEKGQALIRDLTAKTAFMRSELLGLDEKQMSKAYKKAPELETYRVWITDLRRRRDRVLAPDSERILNLFADNLWATVDLNELESPAERTYHAMISDMDLPMVHDEDGEEVQLTLALYGRLRASKNREVRREATEGLLSTLRKYQHVFASTMAGQAETDVALARARGYDTALEAYLDKDGIDAAAYINLVEAVGKHTELLHRYVKLRKEVLGLDEVHLYDMHVPLVEGVDKDIGLVEAREIVLEALAPLGEEAGAILKEGMDPNNGWMDVYPHADKSNGAFCSSSFGVHPFILLNHQDSANDMSTLAHEFGHGLHSTLAMQNQPRPHWSYAGFLAETPSTIFEVFLADHLLKNAASDEERIYLLTDRLDRIRGTVLRQTQFAEFEWKLHQFAEAGTPITAELLDQTYRDLVQKYYGPDYVLGDDDGLEWAYVRHFYYKYYVYTYATGLTSGIAIAAKIKEDGDPAREAFLQMLKDGGSKPALDLLKSAGADMSTSGPVDATFVVFEQTLGDLEKLLADREPVTPTDEP